MAWSRACGVEDVPEGSLLGVEIAGKGILVSNIGGQIRATDRTCTHADADLAGGFAGPDGVRCPLHLSVFDTGTGMPQNPPAELPLRTYNVKIDDGGVYVEA